MINLKFIFIKLDKTLILINFYKPEWEESPVYAVLVHNLGFTRSPVHRVPLAPLPQESALRPRRKR